MVVAGRTDAGFIPSSHPAPYLHIKGNHSTKQDHASNCTFPPGTISQIPTQVRASSSAHGHS